MLTLGTGRACIFHGHIPSWFEAVLAFAMLQLRTRRPQKWVILGVKNRSQWQIRSGAGSHRRNSLAPQITLVLIGKHG